MSNETIHLEGLTKQLGAFRERFDSPSSQETSRLLGSYFGKLLQEKPIRIVKTGLVPASELFDIYKHRKFIVEHNNKQHLFEGFDVLLPQLEAQENQAISIWVVKFRTETYFLFVSDSQQPFPIAILRRIHEEV